MTVQPRHIAIPRRGTGEIPLLSVIVLLLILSSIAPPVVVSAQDRPPRGLEREKIWPAPTAEDWKKPCLIHWQRTWEDALAVSKETGKPILICVNMDGEIASEHYAGIRYRDPKTAALYEKYVCVIASVYRHNPRDYDEQGRRILCPRFGSVTCGEHIAMESGLYKRYFDGRRIAPRHIGVQMEKKEMYDVYYAFDTESVFDAIREGSAAFEGRTREVIRSDRPVLERVLSRDNQDRTAVEQAYLQGGHALRKAILDTVAAHPETEQLDLLRLAALGFDVDLSRQARRLLAQTQSPSAYNLISEVLRMPMEPGERDALVGALVRLGQSSPKARMLAVVHQGLSARSDVIDAEAWLRALEAAPPPPPEADDATIEARLADQAKVLAGKDPALLTALAEAFLDAAYRQSALDQGYARSLFRDARSTAARAGELGADPGRTAAVSALAAYELGDTAGAYALAETAVRALPPGDPSWKAMAVLRLFADARRQAIAETVKGKRDWDAWSRAFEGTKAWIADLHAAYTVLDHHPFGTAACVTAHYDFLRKIGALGRAARVLQSGLNRFPGSPELHARFRGRILRDKGVDGLEAAYADLLREKGASPALAWFAGYASRVAAEFRRRAGRRDEARAGYDRAIRHFERSLAAEPSFRDSTDREIALALAGQARIAYEAGDDAAALEKLLAALDRKPGAAADRDGLGISPVDTARLLLARLKEKEDPDGAARLEAALGRLDPALLELPAYERMGPGRRRNTRRR